MNFELPSLESNLAIIERDFRRRDKKPSVEMRQLVQETFLHLQSVYELKKSLSLYSNLKPVIRFMVTLLRNLSNWFLNRHASFGNAITKEGIDLNTIYNNAHRIKEMGTKDELDFLGKRLEEELKLFIVLQERLDNLDEEKKRVRLDEQSADDERRQKRKQEQEVQRFNDAMVDPDLKDEFKSHLMGISQFLMQEIRRGQSIHKYLTVLASIENYVNIMKENPQIGRQRLCFKCMKLKSTG